MSGNIGPKSFDFCPFQDTESKKTRNLVKSQERMSRKCRVKSAQNHLISVHFKIRSRKKRNRVKSQVRMSRKCRVKSARNHPISVHFKIWSGSRKKRNLVKSQERIRVGCTHGRTIHFLLLKPQQRASTRQ